jgi:hypothetical protein
MSYLLKIDLTKPETLFNENILGYNNESHEEDEYSNSSEQESDYADPF